MLAGARGKTVWQAHREAAIESLRLTEQIDAALRRARIDTWLLGRHPGAGAAVGAPASRDALSRSPRAASTRLADACEIATATTTEEAAAVRHRILEAVSGSPPAGSTPARSRAWLRHQDGTLEEVIHLATPPQQTDPSWLAAPAHLPAAGDARRAHPGRRRARARSSASAAAGSGCAPPPATRTAASGWSAQTRKRRSQEAAAIDAELAARSARPSTRSGSTARCATPAATSRASSGPSSRPALTFTR